MCQRGHEELFGNNKEAKAVEHEVTRRIDSAVLNDFFGCFIIRFFFLQQPSSKLVFFAVWCSWRAVSISSFSALAR